MGTADRNSNGAALELRSGPATDYRIKEYIKTGDSVTVLSRRSDWVQVRAGEAGDGWVPQDYLSAEPPAALRLERTKTETAEARGQFGLAHARQHGAQSRRALAEWITGACLLFVGMLMGAIVQSMNGRRARPRIRL